jgi:hypothetical protein
MSGHDGTEPVTRDELLYRRIPVSKGWYDERNGVSPEAFDPRKNEVGGISLFRSKYKTVQEVAKGPSKRGYYVAVLRAGDLIKEGIQIAPRPDPPHSPGHVELPSLTCENRNTSEALERKHILVRLCLWVEGPFLQDAD